MLRWSERTWKEGRRGPRPSAVGLVASVVLGALWASGCGGSATPPRDPFGGDAGMHRLRLQVTNHHWNEAALYLIRTAHRRRLGVVAGKSDAEFTTEWPSPATLRILIDLRPGGTCTTREIFAEPGETLRVEVPADLSMDPECRPPAPEPFPAERRPPGT